MQGPNVKKLIADRMSVLAIPANGELADGINFLKDPKRIMDTAKQATKEIMSAIEAVKAAPDNKWGNDDEAIAGEILKQVDERKRHRTYSK